MKKLELYTWLDNYPCGAYILSENGKISLCKNYKNLTEQGMAEKNIDKLYSDGHTGNIRGNKDLIVERFVGRSKSHGGSGGNDIFLVTLFFLILFIYLLIRIKKKCLYII